jgi:hypothetical protein
MSDLVVSPEGRDTIFISHANPEDNDFTRWLYPVLALNGYKVWCDLETLKGGEDHWAQIEEAIRTKAIRFLYVSTLASNKKEGTLKELAVAVQVKKKLGIPDFIIPLHLDNKLSHGDVNIELVRLNAISSFARNWYSGSLDLLEKLRDSGVPKGNGNPDLVNSWFRSNCLPNGLIDRCSEEYLLTNLFPINHLPSLLHFHKLKTGVLYQGISRGLDFPVRAHGGYVATFANSSLLRNPDTHASYCEDDEGISLEIPSIVNGQVKTGLVRQRAARNILVDLLNKSFRYAMRKKGLWSCELSDRKTAYWPKQGLIDKDKVHFINFSGDKTWKALTGKHRNYFWHFALSSGVYYAPEPCFNIVSHIVFTVNGRDLVDNKGLRHRLRRAVGKDWWNNDWRDRLTGILQWLSDEHGNVALELGTDLIPSFSTKPLRLRSNVSYAEPDGTIYPAELDLMDDEEETEDE